MTNAGPSGIDGLLEPSLKDTSRATSIYSMRASFFVAFIGGGFAILLFSALNSHRLGRLGRDAWFYAAAGALVAGTVWWLAQSPVLPEALTWLGDERRAVRNFGRVLGLVFCGGVYLLHGRFHRAANLAGEDPPSPWVPALISIFASIGLSIGIAVLSLHQAG